MDFSMKEAVRGFQNQAQRFEVISNNIANSSTPGFKKDIFSLDAYNQETTVPDMKNGPVKWTGNALDFSIEGQAFFEIKTPAGLRYTRQGSFTLNSERELVNPDGFLVMNDREQPITVNGSDITVGPDGTIEVDGRATDKLGLMVFDEPKMLAKENAAYYAPSPQAGEKQEAEEGVLLKQGYLEQSNVVVAEEMVRMIDAMRKYESFQKVISTISEMDDKAITDVGIVR